MKQQLDEERIRADAEWKRIREQELAYDRQQRKKNEERKGRDEWSAKEQREREQIKTETMLPLPPACARIPGIPLEAYEFQGRAPQHKPIRISQALDIHGAEDDETTTLFLRAAYTIETIQQQHINVDKFKAQYVVPMCGAHEIFQWCHDQIYSKKLNAAEIVRHLEAIFGGIPAKLNHWRRRSTYKYILLFFKEMRAEFLDNVKTEKWLDNTDETNLFIWFRCWFCDIRLGAVLTKRADLVRAGRVVFMEEAAEPTGKPAEYPEQTVKYMEASLLELHDWDKQEKRKAKQKRRELRKKKKAKSDDDRRANDERDINANNDNTRSRSDVDYNAIKAYGGDDQKANDKRDINANDNTQSRSDVDYDTKGHGGDAKAKSNNHNNRGNEDMNIVARGFNGGSIDINAGRAEIATIGGDGASVANDADFDETKSMSNIIDNKTKDVIAYDSETSSNMELDQAIDAEYETIDH